MPKPPREQIAAIKPFDHVVAKSIGMKEFIKMFEFAWDFLVATDRPTEIGDDERKVATKPPAQSRGGRAARRFATRTSQRSVKVIRIAAFARRFFNQEDVEMRGTSLTRCWASKRLAIVSVALRSNSYVS